MFTGDLGIEGGDKLLAGDYKEHLKSDYVPMSHHGQHGANGSKAGIDGKIL